MRISDWSSEVCSSDLVGYMGGPLALAARAARLCETVVGYDITAAVGAVARERGIVDRMAGSAEEAVVGAQPVVLAGPVRSLVWKRFLCGHSVSVRLYFGGVRFIPKINYIAYLS